MITSNLISVNGKDYTVNSCDLQCEWVLVHNGTKVLSFEKSTKQGVLQTINTVFEGSSKEVCLDEIKRLNLEYIDKNKKVPVTEQIQEKQTQVSLLDILKLSA